MSCRKRFHRFFSSWHNLDLRRKFIILCVSISVIPIVVTNSINVYDAERIIIRLVFDKNKNLAAKMADNMEHAFQYKIGVLKIAAESIQVKSMNPEAALPLLRAVAEQEPDFLIVVIANREGQQVARSDGNQPDRRINYSDRDFFLAARSTGQTAISDVIRSKTTGKLTIAIAEPIRDDRQQVQGVLIAAVDLHSIINQIEQVYISPNGYAFLVNKNGQILLHPNKDLVKRKADASEIVPVKAAIIGQTGWTKYEFGNQKKLAGYSYVPQTGWGLIAQQPLSEALQEVRELLLKGFLIVLLSGVAAVCLGISFAGVLTKPIRNIAAGARRLAAGEIHDHIEVAAQDEVGELAAAFNHMVSEIKSREAKLRDSEKKYRSVVENINVGIYRKTDDATAVMVFANPALATILGYDSPEELLETSMAVHYHNPADAWHLALEIEKQGFVKNKEVLLRKKDGVPIWCSVTAAKTFDKETQTFCVDCVVEDITQRKIVDEQLWQAHAELEAKVQERTKDLVDLNEKLYRLSLADGLTGIANRRYFDEFLAREWVRAQREQTPVSLIILDVDYFKLYNDHYGHVAGDECLKRIAAVLKTIARRGSDLAARYGGEEFALILPNTDRAGGISVGENVLAVVRDLQIEHALSKIDEWVTVSVGITTMIPGTNEIADDLVLAADQALYQAKQAGRNQVQWFGRQ